MEEMDDDDSIYNPTSATLAGFVFGNIDEHGALDEDFFDEESKKHLSGLSSLTALDSLMREITGEDLHADDEDHNDSSENYAKKSATAVDYSDINETAIEEKEEEIAGEKELDTSSHLVVPYTSSANADDDYDSKDRTAMPPPSWLPPRSPKSDAIEVLSEITAFITANSDADSKQQSRIESTNSAVVTSDIATDSNKSDDTQSTTTLQSHSTTATSDSPLLSQQTISTCSSESTTHHVTTENSTSQSHIQTSSLDKSQNNAPATNTSHNNSHNNIVTSQNVFPENVVSDSNTSQLNTPVIVSPQLLSPSTITPPLVNLPTTPPHNTSPQPQVVSPQILIHPSIISSQTGTTIILPPKSPVFMDATSVAMPTTTTVSSVAAVMDQSVSSLSTQKRHRVDAPLAAMLPSELKDVEATQLFPEFRPGKVLRFSRLFKPVHVPRIWRHKRKKPTNPPSATQPTDHPSSDQHTRKEGDVSIGSDGSNRIDDSYEDFKSKDNAMDTDDAILTRAASEATRPTYEEVTLKLNLGRPAEPHEVMSDEEITAMRPTESRVSSSHTTGDTDTRGEAKVAPWRYGPAQYWYDMIGVSETGEGFDYGFKLKPKPDESEVDTNDVEPSTDITFPDEAFEMTAQVQWEDDIIWNADDARAKVLQSQNKKAMSAGWVPSSNHRTLAQFMYS